jgi:hypothetical protein
VLYEVTKGQNQPAWVSPRTRRVARPGAHGAMGLDLPQKRPQHVNFRTTKQLLQGGWEAVESYCHLAFAA